MCNGKYKAMLHEVHQAAQSTEVSHMLAYAEKMAITLVKGSKDRSFFGIIFCPNARAVSTVADNAKYTN